MSKPSLQVVHNGVKKLHDKMLDKASKAGVLARDIYTLYRNAQVKRWESAGSSEGTSWAALKASTIAQKKKRYRDYPEGGSRTLIATGTLLAVTVGTKLSAKNPEGGGVLKHKMEANKTRLYVGVSGSYPAYVDQVRPFMVFGKPFYKAVNAKAREYFFK